MLHDPGICTVCGDHDGNPQENPFTFTDDIPCIAQGDPVAEDREFEGREYKGNIDHRFQGVYIKCSRPSCERPKNFVLASSKCPCQRCALDMGHYLGFCCYVCESRVPEEHLIQDANGAATYKLGRVGHHSCKCVYEEENRMKQLYTWWNSQERKDVSANQGM